MYKKLTKFVQLYKNRSYVKVRFSNDFGAYFDKQLHEANEHHVVVVIASCKIEDSTNSKWRHLSNMPATRFFINPRIENVHNLRKR